MIALPGREPLAASLASTTAAILVGAALLEAVLPWPARIRPGATVPLLTRLGHALGLRHG